MQKKYSSNFTSSFASQIPYSLQNQKKTKKSDGSVSFEQTSLMTRDTAFISETVKFCCCCFLFFVVVFSRDVQQREQLLCFCFCFCAYSCSVSVPTPVLPQWHIKDTGHSAKSAGVRLHLNTRTPLTQPSRSGLTMPLSRHSVESYPETSSHATCQGTFGHSRLSSPNHCGLVLAQKSGICVHELIST